MFETATGKKRKPKQSQSKKAGGKKWNSDAERMAATRRLGRDLIPPPVKDLSRREECEADDSLWLRSYLPDVFEFPFTDSQKYYIDTIGDCMRYGRRKCIAAPRGDGKSSIFRYLALKYALQRSVRFFLLLSATDGKAAFQLSAIKDKLTGFYIDHRTNKLKPLTPLAEDYPLECAMASYIAPAPLRARNATACGFPIACNWPGETLMLPQFSDPATVPEDVLKSYGLRSDDPLGAIVMAIGWKSNQIQGCNVLDVRPDFVGLDDLDNRDSLASEIGTVAEKIEVQIETNIAGLAGAGKRLGMTMLCTVPSRASVAYRYSDPAIKPSWSGVRVRRIKKWPTNVALRDQYIDLRQRGQKTMGEDGKPVDPDARNAYRFFVDNQNDIEAGSELSNPNDYQRHETSDGTPAEVSGLQHAYNFIADHSLSAFETEYQNNPPSEEEETNIRLTAYHVRANARSDYDRYVCPADTVLVTRGGDISHGGIYWCSVAWNRDACGAIVDFDFEKFAGTEGLPMAACERLVLDGLHAWWARQAESPYEVLGSQDAWLPDLTFIDSGWKDERWGTQPVYLLFRDRMQFRDMLPCKGVPNFRPKRPVANRTWIYQDVNVDTLQGDIRANPTGQTYRDPDTILAELHVDALKLRAHHGLLQPFGTVGSIGLYTPPRDDAGRERWDRHQTFAHHIMAEEWQKQPNGVYQWVAAGQRAGGRRRAPGANHWLDALAYAIGARNLWGVNTIEGTPPPVVSRPAKNQETQEPLSLMDQPYLATERTTA